MEALFLLIGLIVGGGVIGFLLRSSLQRLGREREVLRGENETQTQQLIALHREAAEQTARAEALEHRLEAQQQTQQQQELQRQQQEQQRNEQQKLLFRNLANEILEEKSRQFHQSSEASMESFLKPFRENVDRFRKQVEELYDKETQQRISLKEELRRLNETNLRMSEEATQLTRALKGDSKVQGDWGEMILETILGQSHLVKGVHYLTQENLKDETGNNLRPDVILNLPDRKQIIIDSKVSLTAYVAYAESTTPEASARALKEHLRSVRSHIEELGSKRYQTLVDSPDFVILFMPNEPAFLLAMQHEPTLWSDAYNKKVIVSSPTNLFALLKLVDDLWKRE
ncbi:MAG: DNA recombination protein RmuC, partial [Alistipes sp.]|nr:DNA recombination protein RmuC [Alistipes sp.]